MKKFIVAVAIFAGFTAQAHAWGAREQGILAGIAGTVILGSILNNQGSAQPVGYPPVQVGGYPQQYPQQYPQAPVIINQPPVIVQAPRPHQRVCDSFPQLDVYGRYYGQRTVCRYVPY